MSDLQTVTKVILHSRSAQRVLIFSTFSSLVQQTLSFPLRDMCPPGGTASERYNCISWQIELVGVDLHHVRVDFMAIDHMRVELIKGRPTFCSSTPILRLHVKGSILLTWCWTRSLPQWAGKKLHLLDTAAVTRNTFSVEWMVHDTISGTVTRNISNQLGRLNAIPMWDNHASCLSIK